ncbi:MAG: SPOR domain-containing protein [Bacteroidales bacterium]|nr:SPOR domain-containing protein [Bacteroidales bacterium]
MARDISGYIREMLFRHDCVIIPGFGAFIGNYFPARTDRREGFFQPPSRKITFNRHLTGNDGLLIGHISSSLGTGYGESRDIVLAWADELRRKIMTGNHVVMDHLGTFSLNYEGAIVFEPDTTVNYLLSSYGLTAYHRQPVTGMDVRKMVLEKRQEPSVRQPSVRSLLTRAAVIIPVMVALALVPFNDHLFKGNIEESTLNPLARAELEFNREQIDAGKAAAINERMGEEGSEMNAPEGTEDSTLAGQITGEEPVQAASSAAESTAKPPVTATPRAAASATGSAARPPATRPSKAVVVEEYRYLIIIGSFQGEDNALTMVERLRRQGFDPEVAGGPDGFLRVSTESFGTLDEARAVLGRVQKDFPGAWVYKSRE